MQMLQGCPRQGRPTPRPPAARLTRGALLAGGVRAFAQQEVHHGGGVGYFQWCLPFPVALLRVPSIPQQQLHHLEDTDSHVRGPLGRHRVPLGDHTAQQPAFNSPCSGCWPRPWVHPAGRLLPQEGSCALAAFHFLQCSWARGAPLPGIFSARPHPNPSHREPSSRRGPQMCGSWWVEEIMGYGIEGTKTQFLQAGLFIFIYIRK